MQHDKRSGLAILSSAALWGALACSSPAPSWEARDAFRQCGPALQGEAGAPALTCEALSMCANEAPLHGAEVRLLDGAVARLGCAPL
ncbi:MAG: hypothetical protein AB8H86_21665 [Polyangiales bacterium]